MPCERSTLGSDAQSLQTMQCVRLETGGVMSGHVASNAPSWLESMSSSVAGVQSWQLVLRCSAISKPSLSYCAACACVICEFGYA